MRTFHNANEAKRFFIARIVEQAHLDAVPLSDVEAKMLLWTEQYPVPGLSPDQLEKLSDEFDAKYDSEQYERKIAGLLQKAYERDTADPALKAEYLAAYEVLSKEDHYLLVMMDQSISKKLAGKKFGTS